MAAYVIANIRVTDPAGYEAYRSLAPASIAQYGGRYIVRGGAFEKLEGDWNPSRLAILEFPSLEQARRWYTSKEYAQAKPIRMQTAVTDLVIVDGIPPA